MAMFFPHCVKKKVQETDIEMPQNFTLCVRWNSEGKTNEASYKTQCWQAKYVEDIDEPSICYQDISLQSPTCLNTSLGKRQLSL